MRCILTKGAGMESDTDLLFRPVNVIMKEAFFDARPYSFLVQDPVPLYFWGLGGRSLQQHRSVTFHPVWTAYQQAPSVVMVVTNDYRAAYEYLRRHGAILPVIVPSDAP